MLVAVLLLFLVTEIPQGVLGLLSGVQGECFFRNCYHNFGEVMDILALLNGAINFILYCSMSRQFRTTFGELFKPRIDHEETAARHAADRCAEQLRMMQAERSKDDASLESGPS